MPEMILGLDIGASAVKAVLARASGHSIIRILSCETVRLENGVDLPAALEKIGEIVRPMAGSKTRCVITLPPGDVMLRQIRLPFRDDNKIRKTLSFELEPLLPRPIGDVIVDYLHLADNGLLAAACDKKRVGDLIAAVEAHLGPVAAIDISAAALALPLLEQKLLNDTGLIVDIGASSTSAVFYEKNTLVQIRSFAFGGMTVTRALAEDLSVDPDRAESLKISAEYDVEAARALAACREFCAALANTLEFMTLNDALHGKPQRIITSGGGSLFPPLVRELEKTLNAPAIALERVDPDRPAIDADMKDNYSPSIMNTALAAAKRAQASRKSFNFRQGEYAAGSIYGSFAKKWRRMAVVFGIILALAAIDVSLDYAAQARQARALKNQMSQIFKKHFPPTAAMVDPVSQLKTKLAEDRRLYGLEGGASGFTVLDLLKEISGLIPPSLNILLTHLHYENNVVLLKGEAKNIDDVTRVKNELLRSKHFKDIAIGSTRLGRAGANVDFDLRIELR